MWFSIGVGEVFLVGCLGVITAILAIFGLRAWRWAAVALCGIVVAAILSPADPASTLLWAAVCVLFYASGAQLGRSRSVAPK